MSPSFEYQCDSCGTILSLQRGDRISCPNCGLTAKRRFSFNRQSMFQDHYNNAVGRYVTNDRQFRDELKKGAEAATQRTGLEHNYEPVDVGDRAAYGITEEHIAALEPTYKKQREMTQ
jgi:DNA-directed RNA polymerase subunit RPC12/RpoP